MECIVIVGTLTTHNAAPTVSPLKPNFITNYRLQPNFAMFMNYRTLCVTIIFFKPARARRQWCGGVLTPHHPLFPFHFKLSFVAFAQFEA
jgi:hypothetical protein